MTNKILALMLLCLGTQGVATANTQGFKFYKNQKFRPQMSMEAFIDSTTRNPGREYGSSQQEVNRRTAIKLKMELLAYHSLPSQPKDRHALALDGTPQTLMKRLKLTENINPTPGSLINEVLRTDDPLSAYLIAVEHFQNQAFGQAMYWFNQARPYFYMEARFNKKQQALIPVQIFYHAGPEFRMAHMYIDGLGVKKSNTAATFWLEQGAIAGDVHSALVLNQWLIDKIIPSQALKIKPLALAAEHGNIWAKHQMLNNDLAAQNNITRSQQFIYCLDVLLTENYFIDSHTCERLLIGSSNDELANTQTQLRRWQIITSYFLIPNPVDQYQQ
jgi:TPR repeat protein